MQPYFFDYCTQVRVGCLAIPLLAACLGRSPSAVLTSLCVHALRQDADCSGGRKCMQLYADDVYAKPFVGEPTLSGSVAVRWLNCNRCVVLCAGSVLWCVF